jgi:hypothetical protein
VGKPRTSDGDRSAVPAYLVPYLADVEAWHTEAVRVRAGRPRAALTHTSTGEPGVVIVSGDTNGSWTNLTLVPFPTKAEDLDIHRRG